MPSPRQPVRAPGRRRALQALAATGAWALLGLAAGCSRREGPAAAGAAPAAGPVPGGTLKVSVALDTGSLDLHSISHTNAQWLGRLIYDNLVCLDDAGNISPWLATAWTVSPDGLTYTFKLRDDVTFSDGARFDAEAVRLNLEHMRDPATKSPLAAAYIAPYDTGRAIDAFTFEATLREPYEPFLHVLAQSWLSMASPKAIQETPRQMGEAPVGSGPFVVESYTRQQGIRLVRRPDYRWAPAILQHEGPALLERIELDFVAEPIVRYNALAAGQHDLTIDAPPQNAAAIRADRALTLESRVRTGIPMRGISFNTEKAPFDDVRIRKALALAIDRDAIAQMMGFGLFEPKTDFLASNTRHYDRRHRDALRHAPQAAARLLDEAGWSARDAAGYRTRGGVRLGAELLVTESATPSAVYAAVQADLKRAGFDLRIVQLPAAQLTERRNGNAYQALGGGVWHTNTPDALYIVHHSNEITSERRIGQNTSRLRDAELDRVLARARATGDASEAAALYGQAQHRLTELVPAVPLYENHAVVAYRNTVRGLRFDTSHNTPVFIGAWLDQEAS